MPKGFAVDEEGRSLPYTEQQVDQIVDSALKDGRLSAAILTLPDGSVCIKVLGEPSRETCDILEAAAHAYRLMLRGH